jgi:hypothetical protein
VRSPDTDVVVEVIDHGAGVDPAEADKIFCPSTDRRPRGAATAAEAPGSASRSPARSSNSTFYVRASRRSAVVVARTFMLPCLGTIGRGR